MSVAFLCHTAVALCQLIMMVVTVGWGLLVCGHRCVYHAACTCRMQLLEVRTKQSSVLTCGGLAMSLASVPHMLCHTCCSSPAVLPVMLLPPPPGTVWAMVGALVLAQLMAAGGAGSPAFIIAYYLTSWMGKGYLAIAGAGVCQRMCVEHEHTDLAVCARVCTACHLCCSVAECVTPPTDKRAMLCAIICTTPF